MKFLLFFLLTVCDFAFAESLNPVWRGEWFSSGGKSNLRISNVTILNTSTGVKTTTEEFQFIDQSNKSVAVFTWINSPPKDGVAPETIVSEDGSYNVCFYRDSFITRKKLLINLASEKDQERSTKIRSRESLNYEIFINKWLKLINSLSSERFKVIECTEYIYSTVSKNYELLGSGDGDVFYFYDQNTVYRWSKNEAVGGLEIETYSRR
jgi:hypothetical protein